MPSRACSISRTLSRTITKDTAAVIIQTPNFFGIVENVKQAAAIAHEHGALLVVVFSEAVSLGLLEPPRDADIVAGELQSFAIPPSYGGPFAGVIACKEKLIRQIPGRLAGETKDANGNRAFCLTLATREQHIRREKATSNICTNQALIALMATVFLAVYGKARPARTGGAESFQGALSRRQDQNHFQRTVLQRIRRAEPNAKAVAEINRELEAKKIIGGLPLEKFYPELKNTMLLCCTEMSRKPQMDQVAEVFA